MLTTPHKIIAAACAVTCLAAFLPWASILGISVSGIHGDGKITLALGLVGLAVQAFTRAHARALRWVEGALGALVAVVALVDMSNVAAVGIYLTLVAGVTWSGAAVAARSGAPVEHAA